MNMRRVKELDENDIGKNFFIIEYIDGNYYNRLMTLKEISYDAKKIHADFYNFNGKKKEDQLLIINKKTKINKLIEIDKELSTEEMKNIRKKIPGSTKTIEELKTKIEELTTIEGGSKKTRKNIKMHKNKSMKCKKKV